MIFYPVYANKVSLNLMNTSSVDSVLVTTVGKRKYLKKS